MRSLHACAGDVCQANNCAKCIEDSFPPEFCATCKEGFYAFFDYELSFNFHFKRCFSCQQLNCAAGGCSDTLGASVNWSADLKSADKLCMTLCLQCELDVSQLSTCDNSTSTHEGQRNVFICRLHILSPRLPAERGATPSAANQCLADPLLQQICTIPAFACRTPAALQVSRIWQAADTVWVWRVYVQGGKGGSFSPSNYACDFLGCPANCLAAAAEPGQPSPPAVPPAGVVSVCG
jgi:hypothetical protein